MIGNQLEKELRGIVGDENYLHSPEHLINYWYDGFVTEAKPDAVLLPVNTEQVSSIMKIACREGIAMTPRGAGTNLSGGSIPLRGGIVLSFTRMNLILELNEEDRSAVVCPESFGTEWKFRLQIVPVTPNPFQ